MTILATAAVAPPEQRSTRHSSATAAHPDCGAARHGDALAYDVDGCRCPDAREGWRLYRKRLREGRHLPAYVPTLATSRRLRGLAHLRWAPRHLAPMLGMSAAEVHNLRSGRWSTTRRGTAARVAVLHARLVAQQPGPSTRAAGCAARQQWAPPWAWDGDVFDIDDPAADDQLAARTAGMAAPLRRVMRDDAAQAAVEADERAARRRELLDGARRNRWQVAS
jgi:hypothetical protein